MDRANYKLFDENLVRNILITSGISLFEFLKNHNNADINEVCSFINDNSEAFIDETIQNLKDMGEEFSDDFNFDDNHNNDNDGEDW